MSEATPLLPEKLEAPEASFTRARVSKNGRRLPQAIAHRGYKAAFPENTMAAFKGAVEIGAHALETDLHLSKDGVLVLSHDANLKRCFGKAEDVINCDWEYLKTLRTLKEPHEPMPRLKDLLEYLTEPGLENIWLLLDIKIDNDADDIMRTIATTIEEVPPTTPWAQRVVLGCWAVKYLPLCSKYLPGFPIAHIGFSIAYAREFLKVPGVGFNMLQKIMVGPFGNSLLKDIRKDNRALFLWTVNEEEWMKWSIRKQVDGVITDDPKKYLEVCESYHGERISIPFKRWPSLIFINIMATFFSFMFRYKYGFRISPLKIKEQAELARAKAGA
ncbi:putative glycerophosphoryl diester phosphodiesterase [Xylogone sp. PMI_703]|nr:putative glycerophosphoryl diester phosphodiesterase [Xylogone sp. PMI_703]